MENLLTCRGAATRLMERCDALALISDEPGRITRSFLSPAMERANDLVATWMAAADLEVERDHAGNLIGVLPSGLDNAPVLVLGSHLDTVRDAGRYDGILGVLLALEVAEFCRGFELPFDLEVVAFADEEGLRFGLPFLGSRALIGDLEDVDLARRDRQGRTVEEVIRAWGGDPLSISRRYEGRQLLGYVEAHIEQGPELEHRDEPLGVLSHISGSRWLRVRFTGHAGHAGTTPMNLRRDALAGAAEWMVELENFAQSQPDLVATIGQVDVEPGSGNVIPGAVELSLDARSPSRAVLETSIATLLGKARHIGVARGLTVQHEMLNQQAGVKADPELATLLAESVADVAAEPPRMAIGAGHDAMIMARIMPMAMLMVRSPGGISHHPDEAVLPEDVDLALQVLCAFIERMKKAAKTEARSSSLGAEQLEEQVLAVDGP